MKKLLLLSGVAFAVLVLLPAHVYSRGSVRGGGGNSDNNNSAGSTPSPTPAPAPVQGIISNVTPFAVSIKTSPQAAELTYKVGRDTSITLNTMPVTVAALKPGMTAAITPAADKIYATSVVASIPVAAPSPAPVAVSNTQPQSPAAAAATPASMPQDAAQSPFGRPMP